MGKRSRGTRAGIPEKDMRESRGRGQDGCKEETRKTRNIESPTYGTTLTHPTVTSTCSRVRAIQVHIYHTEISKRHSPHPNLAFSYRENIHELT